MGSWAPTHFFEPNTFQFSVSGIHPTWYWGLLFICHCWCRCFHLLHCNHLHVFFFPRVWCVLLDQSWEVIIWLFPKLLWKPLFLWHLWQGAKALIYLSEAFPLVEGGTEHQGTGKQMLWNYKFRAADVNKQGKRKKWVGANLWGAMLPISTISPAQLAQLHLLSHLLVLSAPLEPHQDPA